MPRDGAEVRKRLRSAALELFQDAGYEATTATEIAARAGVTERTFFRHFADKREVLFDGEHLLTEALVSAVRAAPAALGAWGTLLRAFRAAEPLFLENRAFSEPRRHIIAGSPALEERQQAKVRAITVALASALIERGVPPYSADLAAQMGMAALGHAFTSWLDGSGGLQEHLARAFAEIRALSTGALDSKA